MREFIPHSELLILSSADGHDGFLLEFRQVNEAVLTWLRKTLPDVYTTADARAELTADQFADDEALKNRQTAVGEDWGDGDRGPTAATPVDLLKW